MVEGIGSVNSGQSTDFLNNWRSTLRKQASKRRRGRRLTPRTPSDRRRAGRRRGRCTRSRPRRYRYESYRTTTTVVLAETQQPEPSSKVIGGAKQKSKPTAKPITPHPRLCLGQNFFGFFFLTGPSFLPAPPCPDQTANAFFRDPPHIACIHDKAPRCPPPPFPCLFFKVLVLVLVYRDRHLTGITRRSYVWTYIIMWT